MRRLLLSVGLMFTLAGMCGGGGGEDVVEDQDPVVVPVAADSDKDDGDGAAAEDENWCCEYKDEGEATQYALTEGPAECNTKYADQDGRWVSGNQCIPCCCETPNDLEDAEAGMAHELTTPKSCVNASGECKAADADECKSEEEVEEVEEAPAPRPTSGSNKTVTRPDGTRAGGTRVPRK